MIENRLFEIGSPAVMQEEQPLPQTPQRRRAELVGTGQALCDAVSQGRAHVMQCEIRKRLKCPVTQPLNIRWLRGKALGVANVATEHVEYLEPVLR